MKVLLTRSELQNAAMLLALESLKVECVQVPLIEQKEIENCEQELNIFLESLDSNDVENQEIDAVIFISPSSVDFGGKAILSRFNQFSVPKKPKIFAVGRGTAMMLNARFSSLGNVLFPQEGAGSQSLLAMDELADVSSKRVLIVTGANGKPFLEEQLIEKEASVFRWECYERVKPADLSERIKKEISSCGVVFLHSAHAAKYCMESISSRASQDLTAIVGAQTIEGTLKAAGWKGLIKLAKSPMPRDMIACFIENKD